MIPQKMEIPFEYPQNRKITGGENEFFAEMSEYLPESMQKALKNRIRLNLHNLRLLKRRLSNDPISLKLLTELEEVHQYGTSTNRH